MYEVEALDIRNYAKYLLQEGTDVEKRELLGCLKGNILLSEKKDSINKIKTTRLSGFYFIFLCYLYRELNVSNS